MVSGVEGFIIQHSPKRSTSVPRSTLGHLESGGGNPSLVNLARISAALPGMEIDRLEIEIGGRLGGIPHSAGTREYFTCVRGSIAVSVQGEQYRLKEGDVLAFPGDHPHAYQNEGPAKAVGFSVVVLSFAGGFASRD